MATKYGARGIAYIRDVTDAIPVVGTSECDRRRAFARAHRGLGSRAARRRCSEPPVQRAAHCLQSGCLSTKILSTGLCHGFYLAAGSVAIGPQVEQSPDFADRESQIADVGDEAQSVDVGIAIVAIAVVTTRSGWDQAS